MELEIIELKKGKLEFCLTNNTAINLTILKWNLPYKENFIDCLTITNSNGDKCKYVGGFSKRLYTEDSFIYLASNKSITFEFNLDINYIIPKDDDYTISLKPNKIITVNEILKNQESFESLEKTFSSINLKSKSFFLEKTENKIFYKSLTDVELIDDYSFVKDLELEEDIDFRSKCVPDSRDGCCPGARPLCHPWVGNGGDYVDGKCTFMGRNFMSYPLFTSALSSTDKSDFIEMIWKIQMRCRYNQSDVVNDNIFRKWFGNFTIEKQEKVLKIIREINGENVCKTYVISKNYAGPRPAYEIAFILIPSDGGKKIIYVNPLFFKFPKYGMDSQIQTFVHELSHGYGDTIDYKDTYGQTACLELARTDPNGAIKNADNFAFYFVEKFNFIKSSKHSNFNNLRTPHWWKFIYNLKYSELKIPVRREFNRFGEMRWGYNNKNGKTVIKPTFYSAGFFSEGLSSVGIAIDDSKSTVEVAFINHDGEVAINNGDMFEYINPKVEKNKNKFEVSFMPYYKNGFAIVQSYNKKNLYYIDKKGLVPQFNNTYEPVTNFNSDGLAVVIEKNVQKRNKIIDTTGNIINVYFDGKIMDFDIDYSHDHYNLYDRSLFNICEGGIYILRKKDDFSKSYYFIFNKTEMRFDNVETKFIAITPFNSGIAIAMNSFGNQYELIDNKFRRKKLPIRLQVNLNKNRFYPGSIKYNLAKVKDYLGQDNFYNLSTHKLLFKPKSFDKIHIDTDISNNYIVAEYNWKQHGLFNIKGEQITDYVYDEMSNYNNGVICAKTINLVGETLFRYLDKNGKPIIFFE